MSYARIVVFVKENLIPNLSTHPCCIDSAFSGPHYIYIINICILYVYKVSAFS